MSLTYFGKVKEYLTALNLNNSSTHTGKLNEQYLQDYKPTQIPLSEIDKWNKILHEKRYGITELLYIAAHNSDNLG